MPSAKTAPNSSHTQSVRFSKKKWTVEKARAWLKGNGFVVSAVDETENQLRFRQFEPDDSRFRYRNKSLGDGITLIVAFPKGSKAKSFRGTMDINEAIRRSREEEELPTKEIPEEKEELIKHGFVGSTTMSGAIESLKAPRIRKRTDPADMNARIREMK